MLKIAAASLLVLATAFPAVAADTTTKTFEAHGQPTLQLNVPGQWQDHSRKPPPGTNYPAAIQFDDKESVGEFSMKVTYVTGPKTAGMTDADLKKLMDGISQQYVGDSVEQKVDAKPLKGPSLVGYYATFTDAHPNPGGFAQVTPVIAKLGDCLLVATILHAKNSADQTAALDMLRGATVAGPARPATTQSSAVRMKSPDGKWFVVFDLPGAEPADARVSPDGKSAQLATTTDAGITCTAYIEPAAGPGDAKAVRDFYWSREKQAPIHYGDVKLSGDGKLALLTFSTEGMFPNAHAYLVHDGKWIDVHLSQQSTGQTDAAAGLLKAAQSVRIEPAP